MFDKPSPSELFDLAREVGALRASLVSAERAHATTIAARDPSAQPSLRNLVHYLALRARDVRALQERLARVGLSSLGRCEAHVLASVDAVLWVLDRLTGAPAPRDASEGAPDFDEGPALLARNARALLGDPPPARAVRILVTLAPDAADDPAVARDLVARGADLVRVNCAHDDRAVWGRMIAHVRAASAALGRPCLVTMDLAGPKIRTTGLAAPVTLAPGDRLLLARDLFAPSPWPTVGCTLAAALDALRAGEAVWFDDGKLGGVVEETSAAGACVRITYARGGAGVALTNDRGLNLPDTAPTIAGLTEKDREDLAFVARHADVVSLSFAQRSEDVAALLDALDALDARRLGVVLKIETRRGFEALPEMLLRAPSSRPLGVMIARGDLALEVGYERLAEVQEEILWICEAAHVPVIWATQVLERLTKDGMPTRAEVTDAAMAERAECVMLNKGRHVLEAVSTLDDILRRMEAHQRKKHATLRPLRVSRGVLAAAD